MDNKLFTETGVEVVAFNWDEARKNPHRVITLCGIKVPDLQETGNDQYPLISKEIEESWTYYGVYNRSVASHRYDLYLTAAINDKKYYAVFLDGQKVLFEAKQAELKELTREEFNAML